MLSLRTPPGGKVRLSGAEGAVWRDVADNSCLSLGLRSLDNELMNEHSS